MIALSGGVEIAWWVALGVGLVVALVVWALLEITKARGGELLEELGHHHGERSEG